MGAVIGLEGTAHTAGVGIVEGPRILANAIDMHVPDSGGIHPREAADHHADVFRSLIARAFEEAGEARGRPLRPSEIDAVAFSWGPGLGPCLRVTATAARAAAIALRVPLVGVNHCVAHLEVGRLVGAVDPVLLYVSGGNTQVIAFVDGRYRVLGETLDIGIGNMLDKLGLSMGLPFPAAPRIEAMAREGGSFRALPYSVKGMDVAFSGILTAAQRSGMDRRDLALSVQETAFAMLVEVTERALAHTGKREALLGGGVAQNRRLVEMARTMCEERGARLLVPPAPLLADNGAMIAFTGHLMLGAGATLPLGESRVLQRFRVDEVDVVWRRDDPAGRIRPPGGDGHCDIGEGLLGIGAESRVHARRWRGLPVVSKDRVPKGYRSAALDEDLRRRRTRHEVRMLAEAKAAGVIAPHVIDVDPEEGVIVMTRLPGPTLRDVLLGRRDDGALRDFGRAVGRLHAAGIAHGDPTTSNVIVTPDGPGLIDMSLGEPQADVEAMAVDLRLARETLESTHPDCPFDVFMEGYTEEFDAAPVLERLAEIDGRGRYRKREER